MRKYARFFEQLSLRSQIREFWEGCASHCQSALAFSYVQIVTMLCCEMVCFSL